MKTVVVGVTGLVGTRMVEVLQERHFPVSEFIPVASERSIGKRISFNGKEWPVVSAEEAIARKPDLAIFSAGADISRELAPRFSAVGCRVVDNSSCWRMDPTKKLVIPEINADVLTADDYIIANPNCSTIQAVVAIKPLADAYGLKRVVYSTYQAVSGAGLKGCLDLENGLKGLPPQKFPHPIAGNCLPHIDVFLDNGYTKEEMKMLHEARKIMAHPELMVSCTCVRVPVMRAHSEALNLEFENDVTVEEARKILAAAPGVELRDNPSEKRYPMPIDASGMYDVLVGRIRQDISRDDKKGLDIFVSGDQLLKGAALNAVQIAEVLNK